MTPTLAQKLHTITAHAAEDWQGLEGADVLQLLAMLRDTADSALKDAVRQARAEGMSWEQVGRWTGVSKQAAQQRYGQ